MMRFKCQKQSPCLFCAECCRFREKDIVDNSEELKIKKDLFKKTGTLYLYPFSRYTINITADEKAILEKEAEKKEIDISILPKKIFISDKGIIIYDYFIDADICPFLTKEDRCGIYDKRPKICKDFPNIEYDNSDFKKFEKDNIILKQDYDKCIEYVRKSLI